MLDTLVDAGKRSHPQGEGTWRFMACLQGFTWCEAKPRLLPNSTDAILVAPVAGRGADTIRGAMILLGKMSGIYSQTNRSPAQDTLNPAGFGFGTENCVGGKGRLTQAKMPSVTTRRRRNVSRSRSPTEIVNHDPPLAYLILSLSWRSLARVVAVPDQRRMNVLG